MDDSQEKIDYLRSSIIRWGKANYAKFIWRATDNHWHALVAEIMLQRTRAEQVEPIFMDFCVRFETPADYLEKSDGSTFANLGLKWREPLLRDLAQALAGKEIPVESHDLKSLPGIGDYIAAAYRSMHLGLRDTIIDSNIVRFYGRFFGFAVDPETRRKKWFRELAEKVTPETQFREYNYGMLDFTRNICRPKPLCDTCPLHTRCEFYLEIP